MRGASSGFAGSPAVTTEPALEQHDFAAVYEEWFHHVCCWARSLGLFM